MKVQQILIITLILATLTLASCVESINDLSPARRNQMLKEDSSEPKVADSLNPFLATQDYYVLPQGGMVRVDFSLYVFDGVAFGKVSLGKPEEGNTIVCNGPNGDTHFNFLREARDINGVKKESIILTATMEEFQTADPGTYRCSIELLNDLGTRIYVAPFEVRVAKQKK